MTAKKIADYIINQGTEETGNGSWCESIDMLSRELGVPGDTLKKLSGEIVEELSGREEVAEIEFYDNCFDLMFWLAYCKDWDGTDDWGCL